MIIANHHQGALGGQDPIGTSVVDGGQGHEFEVQISALCIGHRAMHQLFDDPSAADNFTYPETVPAIGALGDSISVSSQFHGWGYVPCSIPPTREELDTFAIPEAMNPSFASEFGDLTVHEVATVPLTPA